MKDIGNDKPVKQEADNAEMAKRAPDGHEREGGGQVWVLDVKIISMSSVKYEKKMIDWQERMSCLINLEEWGRRGTGNKGSERIKEIENRRKGGPTDQGGYGNWSEEQER